jgi:3-dehydroquinate synthase
MDAIQQQVQVSFRYPVVFTTGVFAPENLTLRTLIEAGGSTKPADVVCVVDDGVAQTHTSLVADIEGYCRAHARVVQLRAPVLLLPGGEQSKNDPRHLEAVHRTIHAAALCRHSYVIVVGGGAVLDVAGYAAATAHRGVRLIRIPTTVLAQDDSGVGVKNGVNGFGKKNYYGAFATPFAVVNDAAFLTSLHDRDWLGGVSEAVKAALIRDAAFFDELERAAPALVARDLDAMTRIVRRSAELHLAHIAGGGDAFETGSSRPLDFGHWSAHKLEQLTAHRLRHGEAVAIGIALDSTYAHLSGWLPEPDWRRIVDVLLALRLPVYAPELNQHLESDEHPGSVLRGLEEFREHLGGRLTILLLKGIGRAFDVHEIDRGVMIRSIEVLKQIETARSAAAGQEGLLAAPGRKSL